MDEYYLVSFSPAVLTYCSICFPVFFALPRFRAWLRAQLDNGIASGRMPFSSFFTFDYYLNVSMHLDYIAAIFLIGALVSLMSPLGLNFQIASLAIAFLNTTLLVIIIVISAIRSLKKAIVAAEVTF